MCGFTVTLLSVVGVNPFFVEILILSILVSTVKLRKSIAL